MPSTTAEVIIEACRQAKKLGATISNSRSFCETAWGVRPSSDREIVFSDSDKKICPLGAVLLGEIHKDHYNSLAYHARFVLGKSRVWVNGFERARTDEPASTRSSYYAREDFSDPPDFSDGWSVGQELLAWVNGPQE